MLRLRSGESLVCMDGIIIAQRGRGVKRKKTGKGMKAGSSGEYFQVLPV